MPHDVDLFEEEAQMVRMTFAEHLEDLRIHLIRALVGLVPGVIIGLFLGGPVVRYMSEPARDALLLYYQQELQARQEQYAEQLRRGAPVQLVQVVSYIDREAFRKAVLEVLGQQPADDPPARSEPGKTQSADERAEAASRTRRWYDPVLRWLGFESSEPQPQSAGQTLVEQQVPPEEMEKRYVKLPVWTPKPVLETTSTLSTLDSAIISLGPYETIMAYLKASIVIGIVLTSPWIFYQIWSFVAAGLYSYERRVVYRFLPFTTGLFLAGVLFCFFVVLPVILNFLLSFNRWIGIKPQIRLSEWMGFATMLPVMFGLSFQLPLVMLALERAGIFSVEDYKTRRRHAILVIAFLSMMLTPPDPGSMLAMLLPALALYELGIVLCRWYRPVAVPQTRRGTGKSPGAA